MQSNLPTHSKEYPLKHSNLIRSFMAEDERTWTAKRITCRRYSNSDILGKQLKKCHPTFPKENQFNFKLTMPSIYTNNGS